MHWPVPTSFQFLLIALEAVLLLEHLDLAWVLFFAALVSPRLSLIAIDESGTNKFLLFSKLQQPYLVLLNQPRPESVSFLVGKIACA